MKAALVQYNPVWEDKEVNKNKIKSLLSGIDLSDISIIVMPEMTLTGFSMEASKLAEKLDGKSFGFYSSIAKEYKLNVFAGLIEQDDTKYFNTLVHINSNGELIKSYRKIHPFSCSGEDKYYTKGYNTVITNVEGINVGLSICYDLRFPELYRLYGKERTEVIINIANWPVKRIEHWKTLLKARAIENQCYIIGVNRVGKDPFHEYNGFSSIIGPMGEELSPLADSEGIITSELDMENLNTVRKKLPFLNDIRLI